MDTIIDNSLVSRELYFSLDYFIYEYFVPFITKEVKFVDFPDSLFVNKIGLQFLPWI